MCGPDVVSRPGRSKARKRDGRFAARNGKTPQSFRRCNLLCARPPHLPRADQCQPRKRVCKTLSHASQVLESVKSHRTARAFWRKRVENAEAPFRASARTRRASATETAEARGTAIRRFYSAKTPLTNPSDSLPNADSCGTAAFTLHGGAVSWHTQ